MSLLAAPPCCAGRQACVSPPASDSDPSWQRSGGAAGPQPPAVCTRAPPWGCSGQGPWSRGPERKGASGRTAIPVTSSREGGPALHPLLQVTQATGGGGVGRWAPGAWEGPSCISMVSPVSLGLGSGGLGPEGDHGVDTAGLGVPAPSPHHSPVAGEATGLGLGPGCFSLEVK